MDGEIVSYGFVLPHWAYWGGLIVFPLVFLLLARQRAAAEAAMRARDQVTTTDEVEEETVAWKAPGKRLDARHRQALRVGRHLHEYLDRDLRAVLHVRGGRAVPLQCTDQLGA